MHASFLSFAAVRLLSPSMKLIRTLHKVMRGEDLKSMGQTEAPVEGVIETAICLKLAKIKKIEHECSEYSRERVLVSI